MTNSCDIQSHEWSVFTISTCWMMAAGFVMAESPRSGYPSHSSHRSQGGWAPHPHLCSRSAVRLQPPSVQVCRNLQQEQYLAIISKGKIKKHFSVVMGHKIDLWEKLTQDKASVFSPEMGSLVHRVKRPRLEARQPTLALNSCRRHRNYLKTPKML